MYEIRPAAWYFVQSIIYIYIFCQVLPEIFPATARRSSTSCRLGTLGIDRFMLGETGIGILKLLTLGVCGVLTIVDWFTVQKRTKERNYNSLMLVL